MKWKAQSLIQPAGTFSPGSKIASRESFRSPKGKNSLIRISLQRRDPEIMPFSPHLDEIGLLSFLNFYFSFTYKIKYILQYKNHQFDGGKNYLSFSTDNLFFFYFFFELFFVYRV